MTHGSRARKLHRLPGGGRFVPARSLLHNGRMLDQWERVQSMSEGTARPDPLTVTERAARRIKSVLAREAAANGRLRISVSGGGCSGFRYDFSLDDRDEPGDIQVERDGVVVVVDAMSLMYVLGAELDFIEDLTGSYFRVSNPNAQSSCGCGSSFAI